MIDYGKMKVSDIKQILNDEGFTDEQLDKLDLKGKVQWVEFHKNLHEPEHKSELEPENKTMPQYNSPEWNEYVMQQFSPGELIDNKYPNVNSLRRVVSLLLGDIVFSGPVKTETTLDPLIVGKAVVTYEIVIEWKLDSHYDINLNWSDKDIYPARTFRSIASSHINNTDGVYAGFPESIAETRAEGRALRKALRLGVVCADELTSKDVASWVDQQNTKETVVESWDDNSKINDSQVSTMNVICDRLDIDIDRFINSGSKQYNSIYDIPRKTAAAMLKRLNQYQNVGDGSIEIPLDILKG